MSTATTVATHSPTVEADLTCGGCDYNLRGLPRDGACPECGHDVAATLQGFSRIRAAWLRRVSWGSLLLGVGLLIGSAYVASIALPGGRWRSWWPLFPSGAVVAAIGTWIFATPARGRGKGWSDPLVSIAVRLLGSATCLLQLYVTAMLAEAYGFVPLLLSYPQNFTRVLEATAIVWSGAAAMTCLRAALLAGRVNDRPGRVQAVVIGILATATPIWGALCWDTFDHLRWIAYSLAMGVAAGWSIVFFVGFAIVLRRRARVMARGACSAGRAAAGEFCMSDRAHRLQ